MNPRQSTIVWVGALFLLCGLWAGKYASYVSPLLYLFSIALLLVSLKVRGLLVFGVCLSALCLGLFRAEPWRQSHQYTAMLEGVEVAVEGRVVTDSIYDEKRQTEFEIDRVVVIADGRKQELKGLLRVRGFGAPVVLRHDRVILSGKLRSGFGTRVASMSFAEIQVVGRSNSKIESFRRHFSAQLFSQLSEQNAALALGILVGQRTTISDENEQNLRAVGLTHIIAVSGYNLSVLVRLVRRRLTKLSKFQSTLLSVLLVIIFVTIAGASASIVRAAWVIGLSLAAWYFGRTIRPIVLLMLSAAASAWFNPGFLWFDLGWWLSFAAFFGVLMVGPQLQSRLFATKKPHFLTQVAIESFAASLLTAPLIIWAFERTSTVSLIANMLVVPVIPIVMVLVFAAGIAAFVSSDFIVSKLVITLASLSLSYVLLVADYLADIPYVELSTSLSLQQMLAVYTFIGFATYILHKKTRLKKPYDLLE